MQDDDNQAIPAQFFEAMRAEGDERKRKLAEVAEGLRVEMEALAMRMKELILSQPAHDLLGYLWNCIFLQAINRGPYDREALQFAMEYVHAVISCFDSNVENSALDEKTTVELLDTANRLKTVSVHYCMATSNAVDGVFGDKTGQVELRAKTTWMIIRGHRYQALEEEFFQFVMAPHDEALRQAYGIDSNDVARGVQAITNAMRMGFAEAVLLIGQQRDHAANVVEEQGISMGEAIRKMKEEMPQEMASTHGAILDMFRGGICNLSRHTDLPEPFLEDLAYRRGENTEFYAPGPLSGTPLQTLPARIKPLIRLSDGFYATDPQFVRDAAYRAIQRGLLVRLPEYREEWKEKQTRLTENAFSHILAHQLQGAEVLNEVYYRDVITRNWVENDTLILLGDVMLQIEAKGGVAAMASPATNFASHVRAIQDLVVKAYRQTKRFLDYLASAPEVSLYELLDGDYVEVRRVRFSQYRLIFPIGLTVENFSPFSTMCKELPEVQPLLGKHPFISMSIDDLFVLARFLPTTGELFHYLEVRQAVAGIKNGNLFDELDHLGAYIKDNRFDMLLQEQFAKGATMVMLNSFSDIVDKYFEEENWQNTSPPCQKYPVEVKSVLSALNRTRTGNWLLADSLIRNLSGEARTELADMLKTLISSLVNQPWRRFLLGGDFPILFWLHRDNIRMNREIVVHEAEVAVLAAEAREIQAIQLSVQYGGNIIAAHAMTVKSPHALRNDYCELLAEAESSQVRAARKVTTITPGSSGPARKNLKPNERCWCGSGNKFKKCHGHK